MHQLFFALHYSDKRCIIKIVVLYVNMRLIDMEYLTTVEMSEIWNISSRRIGVLCAEGRVNGAIKKGKTWLIPVDAKKPADGRRKDSKITS